MINIINRLAATALLANHAMIPVSEFVLFMVALLFRGVAVRRKTSAVIDDFYFHAILRVFR